LTARPWIRILFLAMLTMWALGCSTANHEIKTPAAVPEQFSQSGDSPLPDKWWLSFEDPILNTLMNQALAGNFSLKTAWDRLHQVEALAEMAGADLYPALNLQAGASGNRFREDRKTGDSQDHNLGLAASYELDLWGRIRSIRDAALFDARAGADDLRTAALTLSAQVADAWYKLVEQYGQWDMLDAQIKTNEQVLELVTLKCRTGQVGIADMLQQRQLVESNRGEKVQVASRIKVLEHQLAILLGYPPQQGVAPRVSSLPNLPPMPETGLPARLIRRRPDIRSAYYGVLSADSNVAAAIANRFPRLSLTARVDTSGGHVRDLFDNWLANLAANLVAPIMDGGLRKAEVDRTRAVASEALHNYGQVILDALGEVEDALVREQRQRDFMASLHKQLTLAGQVVLRVRDRYVQGTMDYQRVLDALLSQQKLQISLLTANLDLVKDRIDLCRSLGGGWTLASPEKHPHDASKTAEKNAISPDNRTSG
jgi:NodT family efflux transporter outer membrane factor (OMF) lipoprotein